MKAANFFTAATIERDGETIASGFLIDMLLKLEQIPVPQRNHSKVRFGTRVLGAAHAIHTLRMYRHMRHDD